MVPKGMLCMLLILFMFIRCCFNCVVYVNLFFLFAGAKKIHKEKKYKRVNTGTTQN